MNKEDHKPKPMEDEDDEREEQINKGLLMPCKCTFHDLTRDERKMLREQSRSFKDAYKDSNSGLSTTDQTARERSEGSTKKRREEDP